MNEAQQAMQDEAEALLEKARQILATLMAQCDKPADLKACKAYNCICTALDLLSNEQDY